MKIQRDEFVARIMKEREERKKIEAKKRKAAERDYWCAKRDHCWQAKKTCNLWRAT
jgi:hypothetical protein